MQAIFPEDRFAVRGRFTKASTSRIFMAVDFTISGSDGRGRPRHSEQEKSRPRGVEHVSSQIWEIESFCDHRIPHPLRCRWDRFCLHTMGLE
jgi:hypothetical protein